MRQENSTAVEVYESKKKKSVKKFAFLAISFDIFITESVGMNADTFFCEIFLNKLGRIRRNFNESYSFCS